MADKPKIKEICERAYWAAETLLNKKIDSIVSMARDGDGWRVEAEVIDRKCVPDTQDILVRYEMIFDGEGEILSYKRVELRRRCEMEVVEEEV